MTVNVVDSGTGVSVGDLLRAATEADPDKPALVFLPEVGRTQRWSYAELYAEAERAAGYLMEHFAPGERIGVWAGNSPEWLMAQLGIALAGLVLVPMNPRGTEAEADFVIHDAELAGLLHDRDDSTWPTGRVRLQVPLARAADHWAAATPARRSVAAAEVAQVQYTSGTTGRPKGALLTHAGLTTTPVIASRCLGLSPHPRWLNVTPMFHIGGCVLPTMGCLGLGATHVLGRRYSSGQVLASFGAERISFFGGVPAMLWDLLEGYDPERHDSTSVEVLMSGGAPVPSELVRRAEQTFGARLVVAYGQTEAHGHITQTRIVGLPAVGEDAMTTIGRPLPHTEVRVVDSANRPVPPLQTGEIICRSRTIMAGYLGRPEETARARDADGWLHTGDLGSMDSHGVLRFVARMSELINRGGEKVVPAEVEAALAAHPDVARVAVLGVPDPRLGQRVAAFVVVRREQDSRQLAGYLSATLARHKVPEVWHFLDELPLAASSKVDKAALLRRWQSPLVDTATAPADPGT